MSLIRRSLIVMMLATLVGAGLSAAQANGSARRDSQAAYENGRIELAQATQPPRRDDDGFEPLSELPPDERLPAAPMLVGAYIAVVLAIFLYLLSLSRRLASVKNEIARLETEIKRSGRP